MIKSETQRVVAIVGRPNVGKSALFNRLTGQRLAIVHQQSGVTRDRLVSEVKWNDSRFELIDTGGIALMDKAKAVDSITRGTRRQVDVAIEDAAVILFVTDITSGIVPMDEEVARLLHKSGRKVFVVANKADTSRVEGGAVEFEALGFPVFPISALHNRHVNELMEAVTKELPPSAPSVKEPPLKVAVVGRPNVGKSSFINALLGSERLIVSEIPGTTRDSIEVPFALNDEGGVQRTYKLIDTAGMRKTGKVHESVERFSVFRAEDSVERADVVVLMLDAEQGPSVQDKKIAALINENRKGCVLLVNKWDLAKGVTQREYKEALRRVMFFLDYVPIAFVSAKTGLNVRKSIELIDKVGANITTKLTTGLLNRVMRDAFQRVQPPMVQGHRLKLYYCTQTGTRPIRVRLFVNAPGKVTSAYLSYLISNLRRTFGLEGAPLVLDFKPSHDEAESGEKSDE